MQIKAVTMKKYELINYHTSGCTRTLIFLKCTKRDLKMKFPLVAAGNFLLPGNCCSVLFTESVTLSHAPCRWHRMKAARCCLYSVVTNFHMVAMKFPLSRLFLFLIQLLLRTRTLFRNCRNLVCVFALVGVGSAVTLLGHLIAPWEFGEKRAPGAGAASAAVICCHLGVVPGMRMAPGEIKVHSGRGWNSWEAKCVPWPS